MKFKQTSRHNTIIHRCIVLLILSGGIFSCKKENREITLPSATQQGNNTMGAYINNALWVPELSFYGTGIDADFSGSLFNIDGLVEDPSGISKTSIYIDIRNFNGIGTYVLNANANGTTGNTAKCSRSLGNYITDSLHQGRVMITHFDANKHIVSGTFQIKLINEHNSSDSVNVSSGRFDVTCPLTFQRQ